MSADRWPNIIKKTRASVFGYGVFLKRKARTKRKGVAESPAEGSLRYSKVFL
jgi:hypothetical protein